MFWSLGYLTLRCLLQIVLLLSWSESSKELEIVVLRHELSVLRRQGGRQSSRLKWCNRLVGVAAQAAVSSITSSVVSCSSSRTSAIDSTER